MVRTPIDLVRYINYLWSDPQHGIILRRVGRSLNIAKFGYAFSLDDLPSYSCMKTTTRALENSPMNLVDLISCGNLLVGAAFEPSRPHLASTSDSMDQIDGIDSALGLSTPYDAPAVKSICLGAEAPILHPHPPYPLVGYQHHQTSKYYSAVRFKCRGKRFGVRSRRGIIQSWSQRKRSSIPQKSCPFMKPHDGRFYVEKDLHQQSRHDFGADEVRSDHLGTSGGSSCTVHFVPTDIACRFCSKTSWRFDTWMYFYFGQSGSVYFLTEHHKTGKHIPKPTEAREQQQIQQH